MNAPDVMVSVRIDQEFLDEIERGDPAALNWEKRAIIGWGITIAGEEYHSSGKTSGPVHLGHDGGARSRHVGTWSVY